MIKAAISIILLVLSTSAYSESIDKASGIDLEQVMRLLDAKPSKPVPIKKEIKPKVTQVKAATECTLPGKVIRVVDGDTVYVLDSKKKQHKIRMAGIDAPEKGQPYSKAATKYLKTLVAGKDVCIEWYKKDRYKRLIGVVLYNNQDVNYQMVLKGYAWHFKKYQKEQKPADRTLYAKAQTNSRLSVIGLWQEPDPIKPGDWRDGERPVKKSAKKPKPASRTSPAQNLQIQTTSFSCSDKRFCKHMQSCAEACYYLKQCGITRLDRDKDGIPCESICNSGC